jgi:comEA protein
MNGKERLAGFLVLATLITGIIAGFIDRDDKGICVLDRAESLPGDGRPENGSYLRLDLNEAPKGELMALPGIGEKRAGDIVAWRNANGRFRCVDDLVKVKGIGPATLDRIRPFVFTAPDGADDGG